MMATEFDNLYFLYLIEINHLYDYRTMHYCHAFPKLLHVHGYGSKGNPSSCLLPRTTTGDSHCSGVNANGQCYIDV